MQPSNRLTVLILLTQLSASLFLPTSAMAEMSKARANVLLNICESAIKNGDKGTIVSMGRQLDSQILPKDSRLIQRADACIEASFGKPTYLLTLGSYLLTAQVCQCQGLGCFETFAEAKIART